MDGKNIRCVLCILVAVLVLCFTCVGIIIWLAVSPPTCTTNKPTPTVEQPVSGEVSLDRLKLSLTSGNFSLTNSDGFNVLSGQFKDLQTASTVQLSNCSRSHAEICLANSKGYKISVKPYSLSTANSPQCYNITQGYSLLSDNNNISTCISYGAHHWYGAAEVHDQHWPIEKWSIPLQEFTVRDPYYPGYYGSVQERYWLSSAGVAIHIPYTIPLFASMNASGDGQICFVSKFKDSVYRNIHGNSLYLSMDICAERNLTLLHTAIASHFWEKPLARPAIDTMVKPIWSTWAEYKKSINETLLVEYADRIIQHNFSISQLEIDDDWTPHYGDWIFSIDKFPNAASTMAMLKTKVPAISVWIHPFINTDSEAFRQTADANMLMKVDKVPGLLKWWNPGYAGLLDFSFNHTSSWFLERMKNLQTVYNIDSFKFDAGEIVWIPKQSDSHQSYFDPAEYIPHYVCVAVEADPIIRRQEVRVGWRTQSAPILVRMLDRRSRWGIDNGLETLIPTALTFGLLGYPFVLPDMIGGNAYEGVQVDLELYVRWLQVNVFLPAIQFSIPPWHFNDSSVVQHTQEMLRLRESYTSLFDKISNESVNQGWPIVRPLWWTDPTDPVCHIVDDEFLLGNDLLVAPIVKRGARKRNIYIPAGVWKDRLRDKDVEGGKWYLDYEVSLWELPYFVRLPV